MAEGVVFAAFVLFLIDPGFLGRKAACFVKAYRAALSSMKDGSNG